MRKIFSCHVSSFFIGIFRLFGTKCWLSSTGGGGGGQGVPPSSTLPTIRDLCLPKIWSEDNRKISITIDPPEKFLEESQNVDLPWDIGDF